jgi:tetratricopeptide (TPR) repeat protein
MKREFMDVIWAAHLAREGLALWEAQRLGDAVKRYEEAVACADPEHHETPGYHQQLAAVLSALGRDADSLAHFQKALELEQRQSSDDAGASVALARYFLAEHHAKMRDARAGLEVLAPSLALDNKVDGLLCMVQAECLWQLGHVDEAHAAAQRAMDRAVSAIQREKIEQRLAVVLRPGGLSRAGNHTDEH